MPRHGTEYVNFEMLKCTFFIYIFTVLIALFHFVKPFSVLVYPVQEGGKKGGYYLTRLHSLLSAFLKSAKPGKHNDGSGLWFHKRADGGTHWVLRVVVHERRREMGLGDYPAVGLKNALGLASQWREQVMLGNDPVKVRNNLQRESTRKDHLLKTMTLAAFEARKAELKGVRIAGRWFSPLQHHFLPKLGKVPCLLYRAILLQAFLQYPAD